MTDQAMSPLRRRMIEDMTIRKFAPKTQHDYLQRVKNFTIHLGRSPDTASSEDVRRYQLHLTASGVGVPTVNPSSSGSIGAIQSVLKITSLDATYSITSSALASSDSGTVRPSALAVLRLMASSNLVGV